jgi:hypothetical protein
VGQKRTRSDFSRPLSQSEKTSFSAIYFLQFKSLQIFKENTPTNTACFQLAVFIKIYSYSAFLTHNGFTLALLFALWMKQLAQQSIRHVTFSLFLWSLCSISQPLSTGVLFGTHFANFSQMRQKQQEFKHQTIHSQSATNRGWDWWCFEGPMTWFFCEYLLQPNKQFKRRKRL